MNWTLTILSDFFLNERKAMVGGWSRETKHLALTANAPRNDNCKISNLYKSLHVASWPKQLWTDIHSFLHVVDNNLPWVAVQKCVVLLVDRRLLFGHVLVEVLGCQDVGLGGNAQHLAVLLSWLTVPSHGKTFLKETEKCWKGTKLINYCHICRLYLCILRTWSAIFLSLSTSTLSTMMNNRSNLVRWLSEKDNWPMENGANQGDSTL